MDETETMTPPTERSTPALADAALRALLERRSVATLTEPGPDPDQIDLLLRAAATVPDHGGLRPFRLVVVSGEGRATFAEALARSAADRNPNVSGSVLDRIRAKAYVAPTQILIVASPRPASSVAEWEQVASAACTGFAMAFAASRLGLGAMWKSVPFTRGAGLTQLLGFSPHDQLLGWVNLGTPSEPQATRPPIDPATYTTVLRGSEPVPYRAPDR
jgi:nitroreductase